MKNIGIIGGMGPLATVDLMQKIIVSTNAVSDQEHIHILVDNNPQIPDRTAAILGQGPSPVFEMVRSGLNLEQMGADVLVMACNTAHYFLPQIQPFFHIPVLNMIEETAKRCRAKGIGCVGLLATRGTYQAGTYAAAFEKYGIKLLQPDDAAKAVIQAMIYDGVKAGDAAYDTTAFRQVLQALRQAGAEAFVLGCTEIPVAVQMYNVVENYIDATQVLAECAVAYAGALPVKEPVPAVRAE